MLNFVILNLLANLLLSSPLVETGQGYAGKLFASKTEILASEFINLSNRHPNKIVNDVFRENILTAVYYFNLETSPDGFLTLNPGEVFAFHRNIIPEFRESKIITQRTGFLTKEGYKSVAGLSGNGVCHLASLMNWVANEAGLEVKAEVDHNFAPIPQIEKKYGTSIKFLPGGGANTERQNLYIRNIFDFPVEFRFVLEGSNLRFLIFAVDI